MNDTAAVSPAASEPMIPPHLQIGQNQSEIKYAEEVSTGLICAVFVGDILKLEEKATPALKLGGRLFRNSHCLPGGILTRCAITPLQQGMLSIHAAFIHKDERKFYKKVFTKTNQWNPVTRKYENVVVGKGEFSKNLLYTPIYPKQEIGRLTNTGGTANGVVQTTALANVDEVMAAQHHYFPMWLDFLQGDLSVIPSVLSKLRAHIAERRAAATGTLKLEAVGDALLASCDLFRNWGKSYIDFQTTLIKDAEKVSGAYQRYDEIAERLFVVLEMTRDDRLVQNVAQQQATSEEIMRQNAETNRLMAENLSMMREYFERTSGPRVPTPPDISQMAAEQAKAPMPESEAATIPGAETEIIDGKHFPVRTRVYTEEDSLAHLADSPAIPESLIINNDVDGGITDEESASGTAVETLDDMEAMESNPELENSGDTTYSEE